MRANAGCVIVLMLSGWGYAIQTRPASVDEAGRTLERCLIEVEHLRATCRSGSEIRALEAKLKTANDLLEIYKQEAARYADGMQARTGAHAARIAGYEERIKDYERKILEAQNYVRAADYSKDRLRKTRNILIGVVIGLGGFAAWALGRE